VLTFVITKFGFAVSFFEQDAIVRHNNAIRN
jgi:hypothetical protein